MLKAKGRHRKKVLLSIVAVFLFILALFTAICLYSAQVNKNFTTTFYHFYTDKDVSGLRIALVADLHLTEYGEGNSELLDRLAALKPDIIACAGDLTTDSVKDYSVAINFLEDAQEIAPVYYVPGNHEWRSINNGVPELRTDILATGVHYLSNAWEEVTTEDGNTFYIGGVFANYQNEVEKAQGVTEQLLEQDGYHIVMVHYPTFYIEKLTGYSIDLILSGHEHGGQIRIPGIGGLYSDDQGLLPEYTEGYVSLNGGYEVISRGLSNSDHIIPRINNQPELVIIDIN